MGKTASAPCSNGTSLETLVEMREEAAPVSDDSHTFDRIADEWAKALDEQWATAWASVGKPPPGSLPDTRVGAPTQGNTVEHALGDDVRLTGAMSTPGTRDETAQQLGDITACWATSPRVALSARAPPHASP
jgi:hypothetical protein